MFPPLTRVALVALLAAGLAAPGPAQPPPDQPWKSPKVEYTAFPDLKPPPQNQEGALDELVFARLAVEPPKNPTPLQRVRHEQRKAAIDCVRMTRRMIQMGRWDAEYLPEYLTACREAGRVAGEAAPTPARRVACHEARVVLLKDVERFVRARLEAGNVPPQRYSLAAMYRLGAEADLLKLKDEGKK